MPKATNPSLVSTLLATVLALCACGGKRQPEMPAPTAGGAEGGAITAGTASSDPSREAAGRAERERAAVLSQAIYFRYDEATLSPTARVALDAKADLLRTGDLRLIINGHADERGSDEYNLALGMRRATTAQRYLIQSGVAPWRLEVVSYGEERPADPGHDEHAYAANRRDEFSTVGAATSAR